MSEEFPVELSIITRKSVRTYNEEVISDDTMAKIVTYCDNLTNPFMVDVEIKLLNKKGALESENLGTYGVIKGANYFLGASARNQELALEGLGYSLEKVVLMLTSLGISTCWLGGSFNRSSFSRAMNLQKGLLFPCVISLGYTSNKKSLLSHVANKIVGVRKKMRWDQLFFKNDFKTILTPSEIKDYAVVLQMVRKAPSSGNAQPWRIVLKDGVFHFFKKKNHLLSSNISGIDLQKVDMGIAACHFDMMAQANHLAGSFQKLDNVDIELPDLIEYSFSWIPNDKDYLKTS